MNPIQRLWVVIVISFLRVWLHSEEKYANWEAAKDSNKKILMPYQRSTWMERKYTLEWRKRWEMSQILSHSFRKYIFFFLCVYVCPQADTSVYSCVLYLKWYTAMTYTLTNQENELGESFQSGSHKFIFWGFITICVLPYLLNKMIELDGF